MFDLIDAGAGDDRIAGDGLCPPAAATNFCTSGGLGNDRIFGGTGNDTTRARDDARDLIRCGSGEDKVTADRVDKVNSDCERVSRR